MKIHTALLLFVSLFTTIISAQEAAIPTIADLRAKYDASVAKTTGSLAKFQDRYLTELAKLQDQAQKAGKLELILEIRDEAKTFRDGTPKPTKDPDLLKLRQIYAAEVARLAVVRAKKIATIQAGYKEELLQVQVNQTKAGNVEAAIAARDEIKRIEGLASVPPPAAPEGQTPKPEPATTVGTPDLPMEEKEDRKSDEKLADWLVGTTWREGRSYRIEFPENGKALKISPQGTSKKGTVDTDEDKGHVLIDWESEQPSTLEISKGGERLSDRQRSTTWVRLDHHLKAVERFTKKGPTTSKSDLERRLRGTTWSRNHGAKQPFLYEFDDKGTLFLSMWGASWRNRVPYIVTDERHVTIANQFKMEFSDDMTTWVSADGGTTGILVTAE